jgi:hypothetical protein
MNCQMPQGHPTHCGCVEARERLRRSAQNAQTSIALNGLLIGVEKERDLWKARCQYNADTAHSVAAERDNLAARVTALESVLRQIGDFAHDKSTGPAVPDALWEVRGMAYAVIGGGDE